MKKLLLLLGFLLPITLWAASGLTPMPPATAADVIAGTATYKAVTPAALAGAGFGAPTNGVTAAQAETINRNSDASGTNVFAGNGDGIVTTNGLTRIQTNQWSRGSGKYYGPVVTSEGIPLVQNNGWGSIDLQNSLKSPSGSPSLGANTNSAGGWNCFIGGGEGNLIYQNQAGFDAFGWYCNGSSIGGGRNNTIVNADTCMIAGGDNNYIGPDPSTPGSFVDDSFIFGIGSAVFGAIDAAAIGWSSTNRSSGGSVALGWFCTLEGGVLAAGDHVWNLGQVHGVAGVGQSILFTNALNGLAFGRNIGMIGVTNAGAIGLNLTNQNNGDWLVGVGANAINIKSNGQLQVNGPLLVSSGTSTNRSRFTMDSGATFAAKDTPFTNRNQQATIRYTVSCYTILGSGDIAYAYLLVDQDADGTYEETDNFVGWADQATPLTGTFQISADLQPNARFMLAMTNAVFGGVDVMSSRISYK